MVTKYFSSKALFVDLIHDHHFYLLCLTGTCVYILNDDTADKLPLGTITELT